jgi:trans-aconitate methyltransferase
MKYYTKFKRKLKDVGFKNLLVGFVKHVHYVYMKKKFGFEQWHVSPKEWRENAIDIIEYLNHNLPKTGTIVEIGCGLGEIIRNISIQNPHIKLYGFDYKNEVITAAKLLDKCKRVNFQVGSFEDIDAMHIDYLIAIGFMHSIETSLLKEKLKALTTKNVVQNIIVDTFQSKQYTYNHNFDEIMPENYKLIFKSKPYFGDKHTLIYKQTNS